MKKDTLEFIKREIKSFFSFFYWLVILGISNWYTGFENTVIIVLALIISKTMEVSNDKRDN